MDHVIGSPPGVVPDLVAGVAESDWPVAVVARALAREAQGHGSLKNIKIFVTQFFKGFINIHSINEIRGYFCRQFRLLIWNSFIGQFVLPV